MNIILWQNNFEHNPLEEGVGNESAILAERKHYIIAILVTLLLIMLVLLVSYDDDDDGDIIMI